MTHSRLLQSGFGNTVKSVDGLVCERWNENMHNLTLVENMVANMPLKAYQKTQSEHQGGGHKNTVGKHSGVPMMSTPGQLIVGKERGRVN